MAGISTGVKWLIVMVWASGFWSAAAMAQKQEPFPGMVAIPGGSFTMGRDNGPADERPAHEVFLPTFYIDRNLVTVAAFAQFVQAHGTEGPNGEMYLDVYDADNRIHQHDRAWLPDKGSELYPVGEVSWHGAMAYCQWRGSACPRRRSGKRRRADRFASLSLGQRGAAARSRFFGGYRGETRPVGQYPKGASPYGVRDMAGQVWEWTTSIYQPYPYQAEDGRESMAGSAPRVARGGSSSSSAEGLTSTSREVVSSSRMATGHAYIGFRCAKSLERMS